MTNWKSYLLIICLTAVAVIAVIQNLMDDHKATDGHSSQAGGGISQFSSPKPSPATFVEMNVSAYCLCRKCCGPWAIKGVNSEGVRITASGVRAEGLICAADPKYPFGTKMDIPGYGVASVEDRGGAIKGNKLDLLFETHQEALNFGRHTLKVKVWK